MSAIKILASGPRLLGVGASAFWLLCTPRGDIEPRSARWIARLDRIRASWPRLALLGYRCVLRSLNRRKRGGLLGSPGRETLGRAHVGACVSLLRLGREEDALRDYQAAVDLLPLHSAALCRPVIQCLLEAGSVSPEAVGAYAVYLGLPAGYLGLPAGNRGLPEAEERHEGLVASVLAHLRSCCSVEEGDDPSLLERKMEASRLAAMIPGSGPRVVILSGEARGGQYPLAHGLTIGRSRRNDLIVPDARVSWEHARLTCTGSETRLEDLGSRNGTWVGGRRVRAPVVLADGTVFRVGDLEIGFYCRDTRLGVQPAWPHLNLGIGYLLLGRTDDALQALKRSHALDPEQPDLFWYAGRANAALGKQALAFKSFATAVKLDPGHHRALYSWAKALLDSVDTSPASGDAPARTQGIRKAAGLLERACARSPSTSHYHLDLSRTLALLGRYGDALAACERALELDGAATADQHLLLADLARKVGNLATARLACDAALAQDDKNVHAHRLLGNVLFEEGDFVGAARHLGLVWSATEAEGSQLPPEEVDFRVRYGRALFETEEYTKGYRVLHTVIARSAEALFYAGRCLARKGALGRALECYRWFLAHRGEEPEVRYYLAATLGNLGEYQAGLDEVRPLLGRPEWAQKALHLAARLSMRTGHVEEAERILEQADDRGELGREIRFERGRLELLRGRPGAAARWFRASLEDAPDNVVTGLWLAKALLAAKDLEGAHRALDRLELTELDRETLGEVALLRGKIAHRQGAFGDAIASLERAQESGFAGDELRLLLADCYAEVGLLDESDATTAALHSKYPGDAVVGYNAAALSCRIAARRLEAGEHPAALEMLESARSLFTQHGWSGEASETEQALADACWRQGVRSLLEGNGALEVAVGALERARSAEPDVAAYRYGLGVAYFRQRRYGDAGGVFRALCDEGTKDRAPWMGLALSLERAGATNDAESVWRRLIAGAEGSPSCPAAGRLGLAGLHARRGDWHRSAEVLRELFQECDPEPSVWEDAVRRWAAFCFARGGDQARASKTLREISEDAADSDALLGVALALEGDAAGAFARLDKVVREDDAPEAFRHLYHGVSRRLAARHVLEGDLKNAAELLGSCASVGGSLPPESAQLLSVVKTALPFQGCDGNEDALLRAYEQVYKNGGACARVLRSYANVASRHAIAVEQEGGDAEELWSLAHQLWRSVADGRHGFWEDYLSSYNVRHGGPDTLDLDGLTFVRESLLAAVAEVHLEFASAYAAVGDRLQDVQRHVRYASELGSSPEFRTGLLDRLRDGARGSLPREPSRRSDLYAVLYRELGAVDARDAAVSAALEAAQDDLWDGRFAEFKTDLVRIADLVQGWGDLKVMAQKTARASTPILEQALDLTKQRLDPVDASLPERKNWMLRVVLNVGVFADSLTSFQLHVFGARLGEVIAELLRSIVPESRRGSIEGGTP